MRGHAPTDPLWDLSSTSTLNKAPRIFQRGLYLLHRKRRQRTSGGSSSFPSTTQAAISLSFFFKKIFNKRKNIPPKFLGEIQRQLFPSYFEEVLNPSLEDIRFWEGDWPSVKAIKTALSGWGFQNKKLQLHWAETGPHRASTYRCPCVAEAS